MLLRIQVFLGVTLCHWVSGALEGHAHLHIQCQVVHEEFVLQCSTMCDIPQALNPQQCGHAAVLYNTQLQ